MVFIGVAGGILDEQRIGDIVIGEDVVNYEMDARAFAVPWEDHTYQLGEIPFLKWRFYEADPRLLEIALATPLPGLLHRP